MNTTNETLSIIQEYIDDVNGLYQTGVAREHSYRPALKTLLESLLPNYRAINEPAHIKCGAPDFELQLKAKPIPMAYLEAKDINDEDLDGQNPKKNKEQFDRYKQSLDHIIFTDYLRFHLYEKGTLVQQVRIAEVVGGKIKLLGENITQFLVLIERIAQARPQTITSANQLAHIMADKARLLRMVIQKAVEEDTSNESTTTQLAILVNSFRTQLIKDLTDKQFADIYAQTITYGMFAARLHDTTPENFSRAEAAELIPQTTPFLRQIFQNIALNLDERIAWIVDDLVTVFSVTDIPKIMSGYGERTKMTDPILHFYEDFLNYYDKETKKSCGVFYTPLPVVNYIVRAIDSILKSEFGLTDGLADSSKIKVRRKMPQSKQVKEVDVHRVQILDPATGTGTFLAAVVRHIHESMSAMEGMWPDYVRKNLIPRLYGFELMMAPYTIAHIKLDMEINKGYDKSLYSDRLKVFLTNSLEEAVQEERTLFSADPIAVESYQANQVKTETPIMVMIGNPPYSGISQNNGEWITKLIADYRKEPNSNLPLQEKKNWLNDDYVKFIHLGEYFIQNKNEGILAYICNNGFLDNPTFRGMRWHLLQTFDKIYILNLHGDSYAKEKCPDGSKDDNIFDIRKGVSINLFVKTGRKQKEELAQVFYSEQYGLRQTKYAFLDATKLHDTDFQSVSLIEPYYFFCPTNSDSDEEKSYKQGFAIDELMPFNNVGVVSAQDNLNMSNSLQEQKDKLDELSQLSEIEWRNKYHRLKDADAWTYKAAKHEAELRHGLFCKLLYRPFDYKFTYYTGKSGLYARPSYKVMQHMKNGENIAIICKKGFQNQTPPIFISNSLSDFRYWSCSGMQGGDYVFPLYLYHENGEIEKGRRLNLNDDIWNKINQIIGRKTTPEELLNYVYASLHSQKYIHQYKEFLKVDFPRVSYPRSSEQFEYMSAIGYQLRELHLMHDVPVMPDIATYPCTGLNEVQKIKWEKEKVYINQDQYFANIPQDVWNFYIGGYQPAQKWLKDRKGKTLTYEDIMHYRKIIVILIETIRLMKEIDQ